MITKKKFLLELRTTRITIVTRLKLNRFCIFKTKIHLINETSVNLLSSIKFTRFAILKISTP